MNIASVSWGDHLCFGEGDGRLGTPDALWRRTEAWRTELGVSTIHWRELRSRADGYFFAGDETRPTLGGKQPTEWDDFAEVCAAAHAHGVRAYLYVTLFDEGWPLASRAEREISYHNAMHARHVSWQSAFSRENPAFTLIDQSRRNRQWGVLCLGYPAVREHFQRRFLDLLEGYEFDGLFVCLRSQSRPADGADEFGFNEPVRTDFHRRCGGDLLSDGFDRQAWRDLRGEYLTLFLSELHSALSRRGISLAVGAPRSSVLGPPLGNMTLDWPRWIRHGVIDEFVIDQNSSKCPSTWLDLWPMHRGRGYLQNYLVGRDRPPLEIDLNQNYAPVLAGHGTRLFVARQWSPRSEVEEARLLQNSTVSGLVFSSFRFDNPGPVSRGDWRRP
jgi:hypothetical protein